MRSFFKAMKPVIHPSAVCYLAQALIKMVAARVDVTVCSDQHVSCNHSCRNSGLLSWCWQCFYKCNKFSTLLHTSTDTHTHSHMWFSTPVWENTMKGIDSDEWCWFRGPGNLVPVWVLGRQWSLYFASLCCGMRNNRAMWGAFSFLFRCWRWIIFAIGV